MIVSTGVEPAFSRVDVPDATIENEMKIGEKITYFIYCVFSPYNMPAFPKVYLQQMLSYFKSLGWVHAKWNSETIYK